MTLFLDICIYGLFISTYLRNPYRTCVHHYFWYRYILVDVQYVFQYQITFWLEKSKRQQVAKAMYVISFRHHETTKTTLTRQHVTWYLCPIGHFMFHFNITTHTLIPARIYLLTYLISYNIYTKNLYILRTYI